MKAQLEFYNKIESHLRSYGYDFKFIDVTLIKREDDFDLYVSVFSNDEEGDTCCIDTLIHYNIGEISDEAAILGLTNKMPWN